VRDVRLLHRELAPCLSSQASASLRCGGSDGPVGSRPFLTWDRSVRARLTSPVAWRDLASANTARASSGERGGSWTRGSSMPGA
jgi:hypothetical protein